MNGRCGVCPANWSQPVDGPLLQLLERADHLELAGHVVHPDRQGQAPVPLLGDHPVAHVAEPVLLPLLAAQRLRQERHLPHDLVDLGAERPRLPMLNAVRPLRLRPHADEPLVHQPVQQLRLAPPAVRVAVDVPLDGEQPVARAQVIEYRVGRRRVHGVLAGQLAEAGGEHAGLVQRGDRRQFVLLAPGEVDLPAAGGGVDDAGALPLGHVLATVDDPVGVGPAHGRGPAAGQGHRRHLGREAAGVPLGRQVVERPGVPPAEHGGAHHLAVDLVLVLAGLLLEQLLDGLQVRHPVQPGPLALLAVAVLVIAALHAVQPERPLGDVVHLALELHPQVRQLRVDRRPDVAGERPRRRRPDQQVLAGAVEQRQLDERRAVFDQPVAFLDLLLADADAAPAAPRHGVVPAVDQPLRPARLEEAPDGVVVLGGHREVRLPLAARFGPVGVGAVPVHPHAEADALVRLGTGEAVNPVLTRLHELGHTGVPVAGHQALDVPLAAELQLLLDLHLDPQPLAVEPVLVPQVAAAHGEEPLVGVLVGAAPGVVDAHRVVGRDGAVKEAPLGAAGVPGAPLVENAAGVPEGEGGPLLGGEVGLRGDAVERHRGRLRGHPGSLQGASTGKAQGRSSPGFAVTPFALAHPTNSPPRLVVAWANGLSTVDATGVSPVR